MRNALLATCLALTAVHAAAGSELDDKVWNHGSADCSGNRDPAIEVFRFDATTYILRQNKCLNFEAPFIYVLIGERQVLVQDTGATDDAAKFPLYEVIQGLIASSGRRSLLVTHSHSHSDHTAADAQFRGKPGVTLIEPEAEPVREYFGFKQWPRGTATIDLGGRNLVIIPVPGHQDESIAVYDSHTGWLLTGDTVYPGNLYVRLAGVPDVDSSPGGVLAQPADLRGHGHSHRNVPCRCALPRGQHVPAGRSAAATQRSRSAAPE